MEHRDRFDNDPRRQRADWRGIPEQFGAAPNPRSGRRADERFDAGSHAGDYDPGREHAEAQRRRFERETGDMRRYDSDRTSSYRGPQRGRDLAQPSYPDDRDDSYGYGGAPYFRSPDRYAETRGDYGAYGDQGDDWTEAPPWGAGHAASGTRPFVGRSAGGGFVGRGPAGYRRADERVRDDVCDHLTEDAYVDASHLEVTVQDGVVTLSGTVATRAEKRRAEDLAEAARGAREVRNEIRVRRAESANGEKDMTGQPLGDSEFQRTGKQP